MTKTEQARYAANFLKRRTSRIVELQSGYNDQLSQFAAGTYNGDTQEQANAGSDGAPSDTTRVDTVADNNWNGTVPGGSKDDSPICGAISIIQQHIASLGNDDLLNKWASTADALKKTVTSGVAQASPNADGQTREPLRVADNTASQNAGSHGYIQTSELQKMETEAAKLTTLNARIVLGSGDKL
jgi:hypothetical protein